MKARLLCQALLLLLATCFSITLNAQLKADFIASPTTGCSPLIVRFTDQSTGNPTEWRWDLGNGTISFLRNPAASYFNPGQYSIKLVVKNAGGSDSVIKTQYITVAARPTVAFNASVTTGCFPLPIQFTDQSTAGTGTIATWQWDFGDGLSSNLQHPLHIYTAAGNYNVSLRVTNSSGCLTTLSKTQYITISSGVQAGFTHTAPNNCTPPVNISFQNSSSGTGTLSYEWLFGDGGSSTLQTPSHIYTIAGSYTVRLVVRNSAGCTDTLTRSNVISVGLVTPSFTAADTICALQPFQITNTSTPVPTAVSWNFGDGTTSTQSNPSKTYNTSGIYRIKMIANFGSCLDSAFKTIVVLPKPIAAFTANDSTNCRAPFTVNFTSNSVNAIAHLWSFGDNTNSTAVNPVHTYTAYGTYIVQLIVTNASGCSDTIQKSAFINIMAPEAILNNLPDSGCVPFVKQFTSIVNTVDPIATYRWNFGDGNTSALASPLHTYNTPGRYTITLVITTAGGCRDTVTMADGIVVLNRPVAKFSATPRDACANTNILFTDESTGNPIRWLWNFGDNITSTLQNPPHIYNDTGYFNVQLIVWNSVCSDTIRYSNYIYIKPPIARYLVAFDCNKPYERIFTDNSIGADSWSWDFGDGNTSIIQNPVHTYSLPGFYVVSLTVTNSSTGCEFTRGINGQIIDIKPSFFASDTILCKGKAVSYTANHSVSDVINFFWDFGDGAILNTTSNAATHVYNTIGNFSVMLVTTDIIGCTDTIIKPMHIRVNGPTAAFTSSVPGSCLNSLISFNDASVSDGIHPIIKWQWNYGDFIVDTLFAPPFQHQYANAGIYNVQLKVTDSLGCSDSVFIGTPIIISKPVAAFSTADTVACPGKLVNFSNQSSGPNLVYRWSFGDGNTSSAPAPAHAYAADGTYTVKLSIIDQYGCTDSITRIGYITVITSMADFVMSDSFSTCPPLIVQFTNMSTNALFQIWDFGDGTTANVSNPSHFYTYPGTYTITLTSTGPGGCAEVLQKNILIKGPTGTFTYNPLAACNPAIVTFTASTRDRLSFIYDFNDGNTDITTDSVISHVYNSPGIYVPKMILLDANGCQVPITGRDTIEIFGVTANFVFDDKAICDAGQVQFTNASISNDLITGYNWSFGDGQTDVAINPLHTFGLPGRYFPTLIVNTANGCVDTITAATPVRIVASPVIDFIKSSDGCTPLTVTFNGLENVVDTSILVWNWSFGNGNTSLIKDPPLQSYNVSGNYQVSLLVTNSSGCKDSVSKTVDAFVIPPVNAGVDTTICYQSGITLLATGASTYQWTPATGLSCTNCANPVAMPDSLTQYIVTGTSGLGCNASDTLVVKVMYPFTIAYSSADTLCMGQNTTIFASGAFTYQWSPALGLNNPFIAVPVASPDTTTTYQVVGTDDHGCFSDTGYIAIKVYPIPVVNAGTDQTINIGQTTDLVPTVSADVTQVLWSPTGSVFRNNYPAISIKPTGNTLYTVDVANEGGCKASDQVNVIVLCNGYNVFIPNTFSPNNDGANDVFYPRGTGLFKIKNFRIYNRWGELMFDRSNFNANSPADGWDGTYKGTKLPSDVFVYMIDIICDNNSILPYKGNVALLQ